MWCRLGGLKRTNQAGLRNLELDFLPLPPSLVVHHHEPDEFTSIGVELHQMPMIVLERHCGLWSFCPEIQDVCGLVVVGNEGYPVKLEGHQEPTACGLMYTMSPRAAFMLMGKYTVRTKASAPEYRT